MDQGEFARVAASFAAFHQEFAPLFGRKEAQRRSEQYVRGLLVQQTDRRNAENVAETIAGATPRTLQRLLTEAPWATEPLIARLQGYVGGRLNTPAGVFVLDESGFAKQGTHAVGVARQYCGALGKVGNCQLGVFLAYASARGHALVDMRLVLPEAWTTDPERCRAAGVPEGVGYQSKAELGLAMLRGARAAGHLEGHWVAGDDAYGMVPTLRDALETEGWHYVLDVPTTTPVFTRPAAVRVPPWSGHGRVPTKLRVAPDAPRPQTVDSVAAALPSAAWQEVTVAEGAQGPRTYQFVARRVWESRAGLPGGSVGCSCGATLMAANHAIICRMRPPTPRWRCWPRWPPHAGRLKRSLRRPKARRGWMSMRCAVGGAGITTSLWLCSLAPSC